MPRLSNYVKGRRQAAKKAAEAMKPKRLNFAVHHRRVIRQDGARMPNSAMSFKPTYAADIVAREPRLRQTPINTAMRSAVLAIARMIGTVHHWIVRKSRRC